MVRVPFVLVCQLGMRTHLVVDLHVLANQLDLRVWILHERGKSLLDRLNLLRDGTEDALFQTIELIEASPCTDLTESDEDTTHGLEVERLVTAEDQDEPPELDTESLDRFRLACEDREVGTNARSRENIPVPAGPNGEPPNWVSRA